MSIFLPLLFGACAEPKLEPPTPEEEIDFFEDTASEPLDFSLSEGRWLISTSEVIFDPCNVGSFNQNLTDTVPSEINISSSSKSSFFLDDETECLVYGDDFICETQSLQQETWGALIELDNTMQGTIVDSQNIEILFSVELLSCSDSLVICGGMEAVLELPCTIELQTVGQKD